MVSSYFTQNVNHCVGIMEEEWHNIVLLLMFLLGCNANNEFTFAANKSTSSLIQRPAVILALLDPYGNWFAKLLYSISNPFVLSQLIERSEVVRDIWARCHKYHSSAPHTSLHDDRYCQSFIDETIIRVPSRKHAFVQKTDLEHSIFVNSLHMPSS